VTIGFSESTVDLLGANALATPTGHFTNIWATAFFSGGNVPLRATCEFANLLGDQPAPLLHGTECVVNVLAIRSPNMDWIPMILPDVFPNDISYNSVGTIRFATDVIVVDSGDDQRVQRWDQPLMEFDIAYGVRTMEQLQELIAFFRAMRGRFYAFNYRDWMDYTSSFATRYEAREAPPITAYDQQQFVGDGATYRFQLIKNYIATTSGQTLSRPITRPEPGSVLIGMQGVNDWTANASVDPATGIVTLLPTHQLTNLTVTKSSGSGVLTGAPGTFAGWQNNAFVGRRVIVSGFGNPGNNVTADQTATFASSNSDGSQVTLSYATGGTAADTSTTLSIALHPAPPAGWTVTAGFLFFTPCRFDTDQLPLTLEDYGIGGAQSIKLIEVRPTAF
jgi:uncharacterized protein (TIGR02217 family)